MTYYVQMKDDVAFAYVNSDHAVNDSIVLEDGIDPDSVLTKKMVDGKWIPASLIYFIEDIDSNGVITKINSTFYSSEVSGEVIDHTIKVGFKLIEGNWVHYAQHQQQLFNQQVQFDLDQKIKEEAQKLIDSRPFPSWEWNGSDWVSPVPIPEIDSDNYYWDEDSKNWVEYLEELPVNPEIS